MAEWASALSTGERKAAYSPDPRSPVARVGGRLPASQAYRHVGHYTSAGPVRCATRLARTGSPTPIMTIGMIAVASLAAGLFVSI
jgi:hypothetical protein